MVRSEKPELILLDVLLAGIDGVELCHHLRRITQAPIILISCKDDDIDKVVGLSAGADDYITKPFSPIELTARVKAHLRRNNMLNHQKEVKDQVLYFGDLSINLTMQKVIVENDEIVLSAREFKVLAHLARHPGRIYSMNEIYELIWGMDGSGDYRTVMVHISTLRKKLEHKSNSQNYIVTVRGAGYKFNEKL